MSFSFRDGYRFVRISSYTAAGFAALTSTAAVFAAPPDTPPPLSASLVRNKYVEPTNKGKVQGRIYDAATGGPLEGAVITVWQDGVFAAKGSTVGKSDAWGSFACEALLGRVSSNVDAKRLIANLFAPIPGPGISQHTRRIDVSRLTIRVQKEGYTTYEGSAPCRQLDPDHFQVTLEPVLLMPSANAQVSAVAGGWGAVRIDSVELEPPILHPGDKATLRAHLVWPAQRDPKDLTVSAHLSLFGDTGSKELKREKERDPSGKIVYSATFTIPKKIRPTVQMVTIAIDQSPLDVAKNGRQKRAMVQVVPPDGDLSAAATREAAYAEYLAGHTSEAVR